MVRALGDRAGGILGLYRLLEEHGEALEFDIPRFWPGRRLSDLDTGDMTWSELRTFVRQVPHDSAYGREVLGVEKATFDQHADLLMQIANQLIAANRQRGGEKPTQSDFLQPPK